MRDLADRIEALQADVRRLGGPGLPSAEPGWSDEGGASSRSCSWSHAWVSSIGAPVRRRPGVPRLLLEVVFLVGSRRAAAVAELDVSRDRGCHGRAWLVVALVEMDRVASRPTPRRDSPVGPFCCSGGASPRGSGVVRAAGRAHTREPSHRLPTAVTRPPKRTPGSRAAPSSARQRMFDQPAKLADVVVTVALFPHLFYRTLCKHLYGCRLAAQILHPDRTVPAQGDALPSPMAHTISSRALLAAAIASSGVATAHSTWCAPRRRLS